MPMLPCLFELSHFFFHFFHFLFICVTSQGRYQMPIRSVCEFGGSNRLGSCATAVRVGTLWGTWASFQTNQQHRSIFQWCPNGAAESTVHLYILP